MASIHKSVLGSFGTRIKTDINGYFHTTAKEWASAPVDWGYPEPTYKQKLAEAAEMAHESREALARASRALREWRRGG